MKYRRLLAACVPAALLCGCASVEGKWSLAEVDPTAERRDFAFQSLTLQSDSTLCAQTKELGQTESVSGIWTLEISVLSLREHGGELHTEDAALESGGKQLKLVRHWDGRRMTAVLERRS